MNAITQNTKITSSDINSIISELNGKLDLSGGTLTGPLSGTGVIFRGNNAEGYAGFEANYGGAELLLYGGSRTDGYAGLVELKAISDNASSIFGFSPSGNLLIDGETVLNSAGATKVSMPILIPSGGSLTGAAGDLSTVIFGVHGNYEKPCVILWGGDGAEKVLIRAQNKNAMNNFWLYPDGTATLGGHSVLTSAGGTLTGQIKKASGSIISCTSDASYLSINGGTDYKHGARIVLSGKDTSGWTGELQLEAHDGTNGNVLRIFPSGEATLGGKYFVHSVNGVNASAAGDVRGMPAGSVIAFAGNSTPAGGFLLCNGAAVSRTTYAALFAAIGTTYGTGNGSTTFNLPNLTDKFIQGSGTAGTVKAAGLPNATGALPNTFSGGTETVNTTSALYFGASGARVYTYSDSGYNAQISLNLSRASSIYGNSTTVQPPALTMRYYIKY